MGLGFSMAIKLSHYFQKKGNSVNWSSDTVLMKVSFSNFGFRKFSAPRRRLGVIKLNKQDVSESEFRKAKLFAEKKERIVLPSYNVVGGGKRTYPISEFLSQPSGVLALLNTSALQNFEALDSNTYRCTLPRLNLLNFDVAPVLDLRVTPTDEDCMVEMLSCKFEGSEIVERQNDHFSALMTNYITWGTNNSEHFLDIDVKLNLTLEIYTQPFTLLPTSAVEAPGTLMMQALVDRLVPLLLQQLLREYELWVKQKCELNP